MTVESPPALLRFWRELRAAAPDADDMLMSGIAANKSGYHNSRENHLRDRPGDYSIELAIDKLGDPEHAAAIDITFKSAQAGRFGTIIKYSKRLDAAYRNRDPRLFYRGERVWREFFGNTDYDRQVEGWSLYRQRFADSDPSHLWHIHQSVHRKFANNWDAIKGALDIMLGRPLTVTPPPEKEDLTMAEVEQILTAIASVEQYAKQAYTSLNGAVQTFERRDVERDAAEQARDNAREQRERDRDAAQDRQLTQLNETLALLNTTLGQLSTRIANLEAQHNEENEAEAQRRAAAAKPKGPTADQL